MDLNLVLDTAAQAALAAGRAILEIRSSGFGVRYKADSSPVTAADFRSDSIIGAALAAAYPDIPHLTEETRDDGSRLTSRYCFIVDPLDGTKEFVRGSEEFTVNIALAEDGVPVVGVIYVPCADTLYFAVRGGGAFRLEQAASHPLADAAAIHAAADTEHLTLVTGHTGAAQIRAAFGDAVTVKPVGSALKGCLVAEGSAHLCVCPHPTHEWDTAAMQCILTEAGALIRLYNGSEPRCNRADTVNHDGFFILNRAENAWVIDKLLGT